MKKRIFTFVIFCASLIVFNSCDFNSLDEITYEQVSDIDDETGLTEEDEAEDDKPSENPTGN